MGKPVKFRQLPLSIVRLILGKEFHAMFRWFNEEGYKADIAGLRSRHPGVHLHTLEEWLREEGWNRRALRFAAKGIVRALSMTFNKPKIGRSGQQTRD